MQSQQNATTALRMSDVVRLMVQEMTRDPQMGKKEVLSRTYVKAGGTKATLGSMVCSLPKIGLWNGKQGL
jgi:hypothetical protein